MFVSIWSTRFTSDSTASGAADRPASRLRFVFRGESPASMSCSPSAIQSPQT